jgi:hypothetical protein
VSNFENVKSGNRVVNLGAIGTINHKRRMLASRPCLGSQVRSGVVGLFEHDSVLRGLIKDCEFLEQLRNPQFRNDDLSLEFIAHFEILFRCQIMMSSWWSPFALATRVSNNTTMLTCSLL